MREYYKNPLPAQVKGLDAKLPMEIPFRQKTVFPYFHVRPVTRGFETFVSIQQSGRSPGLKINASAIFPVSQ